MQFQFAGFAPFARGQSRRGMAAELRTAARARQWERRRPAGPPIDHPPLA